MDTAAYLRRIGCTGAHRPSAETLRELHFAHLCAIPFENLDVIAGHRIVLNEDRLVAKIVDEGRGGFCYELNGAFAALLRAVGYQVTLLSARVPDHKRGPGPEFDHLTLAVTCEGEQWLCDVGFGECFLWPLRLRPGETVEQRGVGYRIDCVAEDWQLTAKPPDSDWHLMYQFTTTARVLDDFREMCAYHQTSPKSPFTNRRICSRATAEGRITLADSRLIITAGHERRERVVAEDEWEGVLREYFGISGIRRAGEGPAGQAAKKAGR